MTDRDIRIVTLRNVLYCSPNEQSDLRRIRNEPSIRSAMYAEHEISADEHLSWLSKLASEKRQRVYAVFDSTVGLAGAVGLANIDMENLKADWAFYLSPAARGGLGSFLEFSFLDYVFDVVGIEKLNCEVLAFNDAVIRMHKSFGFIEEGKRRGNAAKSEVRVDAVLLGMLRDEWKGNRAQVQASYANLFERFRMAPPLSQLPDIPDKGRILP